jgi:FtsP/CotA-like multicopper oxidase with cupredoxin domain
MPSPVDLTSCPSKRSTSSRASRSCASSSWPQRRSPTSRARSVEPTMLVNSTVAELLVKFDDFKGKYVFHCHNLEHEDMVMMGNFQVT